MILKSATAVLVIGSNATASNKIQLDHDDA